jgi:hypothetical protein
MSKFMMNENGQVAFVAALSGDGGKGIWAENPGGELHLIAREDTMLDLGGGDTRHVERLFLEAFNDDGIILLEARFADGSAGIFTSDLVAVPEPTPLALLLSALMGLAMRRRI